MVKNCIINGFFYVAKWILTKWIYVKLLFILFYFFINYERTNKENDTFFSDFLNEVEFFLMIGSYLWNGATKLLYTSNVYVRCSFFINHQRQSRKITILSCLHMIFWIIIERGKNFTLTIFFFFFSFFCFTLRNEGRRLSFLCMSLLLRNGAIKCHISNYKLDLMRPPRNGPACAFALSAQRLCCSLCIPSEIFRIFRIFTSDTFLIL